jgi:HlyD family secretion protein
MAKRTRQLATVAGVVVVVAGGAVIWATSASSSPGYRVATAGPASVTATLDTTGTIEPVKSATLAFPSSGQVASVPVQVGQQVTAGQPLAQLDTTSLASQVASAQSTVASAQAKLAADRSGQVTSVSAGRATPALYVTASSAPSDLKSEQDAVTSAQHQVDLDLTAASAAVAAQQKACQTIVAPDVKHQAPSQDTVDACTRAIQEAQDAQHTTGVDEQKLADAENALSATLAKNATTQNTEPRSTTPPSTQSPSSKNLPGKTSSGKSSSGKSSSGQNPSSGGKASAPASAEQLAADQAVIDAADAQVAVAQQNLAAATLVSPIAGTVGEIGFTQGQTASTQQHIVVFGPGANQVTTAVSDTQAGRIRPGQQATVTPDGSGKPITGQVTSIGLLASTTSSGSPSYPVTISLPASGDLFPGATASVSIVTSTANAAVTVPTSAVHLVGGNAAVTTLSNGKTQTKRVTVGVIGASVTEIKSGLDAGEQVVLADLSQPLPTSNTTGARGLVGGGGGGGLRRG